MGHFRRRHHCLPHIAQVSLPHVLPALMRSIARQQFGNLQHKTFPIYFSLSLAISTGLLGYWTISNPVVLQHYLSPRLAPVAQAWALLTVILAQSLVCPSEQDKFEAQRYQNYFVIGPITSKTMFQRHKLEKAEGKSYNEAGVTTSVVHWYCEG